MAKLYSNDEYAFIETCLDEKLCVGPNAVDMVMNFLGDGLCTWCEAQPTQGSSNWCEECNVAFDSIDDVGDEE